MAEASWLWFVVPGIPPSGNHYKAPVRRGKFLGFYLTKEAKAFKEAVWVAACGEKIRAKAYIVEATVWMGKGDRGDADNFWKCLLDALVYAGCIDTDAKVSDIILHKRRDRANPRTEICVRNASEEES